MFVCFSPPSTFRKRQTRPDTSLEERIRQLTCNVDEPISNENDSTAIDPNNGETLERRDSPAGEETPQQAKYVPDKSFSPLSSASSSSSGSTSAYRKITEIFHKDKRQERIPEADENPIVIIPQQLQECRCPAAPDLGMGMHMPAPHTQIHQTPPRQTDGRRQFLSTLAPLTACVVGQRDDLSYYTLAPGDRVSAASSQGSEYSLGDIDAALQADDAKKVAPDVIAGTPGQEQDELAAFAQQEATRTERLKKRYSAEASCSAPNSNAGSDDDEQNDYGFNKRPSVRGIKPRFGTTNEILQQMQEQLSVSPAAAAATVATTLASAPTAAAAAITAQSQGHHPGPPPPPRSSTTVLSNTLPKANSQALQLAKKTVQAPQQQSQQQLQAAAAANNLLQQQNIATWNAYYQEQAQRNSLPPNHPHANYYHHLPIGARHSFHGHEESTIYQNCHSIATMEQHYGTAYARSPTRRPESPPPLRNYHQTMVLIPYNTESFSQYSANEPISGQGTFRRHNVLEYQQVCRIAQIA